jgi:hypothetical protein
MKYIASTLIALSVTTIMALAGQDSKSFDSIVQFPTPKSCLSTLKKDHPRLMLSEERLKELKAIHEKDTFLQKLVLDVLKQGDGCIKKAPLVHKLIGPRLLSVSRDCLHRVMTLSLCYRWTSDKKYADAAIRDMLAVCAFPDWNPSHYLDTAEMTNAVSIGYDWLYSYMTPEQRETIKKGLIKLGLEQGLIAYEKKVGWTRSEANWNQVCNGGMIIGALAVADTDPKYAQVIIPAAVKSLPTALISYAPDGSWMEGPGYWHYATQYTAYGLAALRSALGTDFGLTKIQGLSNAGLAPIYLVGPKGEYLGFADCHTPSYRGAMACMFWLGEAFSDPEFVADERRVLEKGGTDAEHVIWYCPQPTVKLTNRDLDFYFRGNVEVVVFRSAWNDPGALFVGAKAGYNQVNHGHLDLGNFELDALGVRWAVDLGADEYNMPGYWDGKKGGKRWEYYRLNSFSHNVPLLNNQNQDELAKSKFLKCVNGTDARVVVDLSEAYKENSRRMHRGIEMVDGRRAVLVQDEFEIEKATDIAWGMTTRADVAVRQGGRIAELTQDGQKLLAIVLSPAGGEFAIESAHRDPPEDANDGVTRLVYRLPKAKGDVRVAILLSPVWPQGETKTVELRPLAEW